MARRLLIIVVLAASQAMAQTGLEAFNYSIGDTFFYSEITSGASTNHTGILTKYTIVSKAMCQSCYQYAIQGIRQEWYSNLEFSGSTSNYFSDTLFICQDEVEYWNHLNAEQLKSSIIGGVIHGSPMPSDQAVLGNQTVLNHVPTDLELDVYEFYESDTAGIVISNLILKDPDGHYLTNQSFVPSCDAPNDNNLFKFDGIQYVGPVGQSIFVGRLASNATFNFDVQSAFLIRIKAEDSRRGIIIKEFALTLRKGTRPKPSVALSNSSIPESLPPLKPIGKISVPADASLKYELFLRVENVGAGNGNYFGSYMALKFNDRYLLRHDTLFSNTAFDYEHASTDSVKLIAVTNIGVATDLLVYPMNLVISILDGPDCPKASISRNQDLLTASDGAGFEWRLDGALQQTLTSKSITVVDPGSDWFPVYSVIVTDSQGCASASEPFCRFVRPKLELPGPVQFPWTTIQIHSRRPGYATPKWFRDGVPIQPIIERLDSHLILTVFGNYTIQNEKLGCYSTPSEPFVFASCSFIQPEPPLPVIYLSGGGNATLFVGTKDVPQIPGWANVTFTWRRDGKVLNTSSQVYQGAIDIDSVGTYVAEVGRGPFCTKTTDPFIVTLGMLILPEPTVPIITSIDDVLQATVASGVPKSLNWYRDGKLLSQFTNKWHITPDSAGAYIVEVLFRRGIVKVSDPFIIVITEAASDLSPAFTASPNPSLNQFSISQGYQGSVNGFLYSATGQLIQVFSWDSSEAFIVNADDYSPGIYLLRIVNDQMKHWERRLMKE